VRNQVFKTEKIDASTQPMFFGEPVNVARYDRQKYPFLEKQIKNMLNFFWVPEEVGLDKDPANFHKELSKSAQHIFTSNLYYQILLDSVQGRAPCLAILPFTSLPELETLVTVWTNFESLHSRSYTHIIRGIYNKPDEMLDGILDIEPIISRAKSVTKYYDDFIEYGNYYNMLGYGVHTINGKKIDINEYDLHKKLYLMIVAMNILEGIRFYVSFACTWAFAESMKVMEKSAKIIKFICRDENLHLAVTSFILKKFSDGSEGALLKKIASECEQEVYKMYDDAVMQEKDWADYLFQHGSIVGLNAEILKEFVEYIANKRIRAIGLKSQYDRPTNPLPWTEHWIGSKNVQEAPQETEITSYVIGGIKNDVSDDMFKDFKL
jgi:ribonucleoside-diphosphate reductase beta chain